VTPPARWRHSAENRRGNLDSRFRNRSWTRLEPLLDRGLMVREGMSYLSLAISVGEYSPGVAARRKLQHLLAASAASGAACTGDPCVSQNGPPLPGLDLAVIRGVTLSLREDASLVEAGENALAITGSTPGSDERSTPGLHAAWRRLASVEPRRRSSAIGFRDDGLAERALLRVQLQRCDTLGLYSTRWSRALARWRSSFPCVAVPFPAEPSASTLGFDCRECVLPAGGAGLMIDRPVRGPDYSP
jgi:hypothetical protein